MKRLEGVTLKDVQEVYTGPEGDLWELIMGEQIHIGGLRSSIDLAEKAGIGKGMAGIDFCCCNGAGMRFLVRFRNVERMIGVDATEKVIERGRLRCKEEGLSEGIGFILADACDSNLPSGKVDFVWGEDAWCYVTDKQKLIAEAARVVKPGGIVAFTDWVEGRGLTEEEANRYLRFMKFPGILSLNEYAGLLSANNCRVITAEDTGRFAPCVDLYLDMLKMQLTYDALKIIGFDNSLMQVMAEEMEFIQRLARADKIAQGLFVAQKKKDE